MLPKIIYYPISPSDRIFIIPRILEPNPFKLHSSRMFSTAIIAGLLLSTFHVPTGVAQPVNPSSFIVKHIASDYFPDAKGDLSHFDVHAQFVVDDSTTQSWLTTLDPASGDSDEEKAKKLTEAAYAKPFDAEDPDMTGDVDSLLAAIAGNSTTHEKRQQQSAFAVATAHAVKWSSCAGVLSCLSGTTCSFNIAIGQAPRSQCQVQAKSTCCISWSNYNVRVGFFSSTWTICNDEVTAQGLSNASCEGYGSASQGGDVCLSNRASGCT